MIRLLPIVEGQGEVEAFPTLLRNILYSMERWDVQIESPLNTKGKPNLTRENGLEKFLKLGFRSTVSGILVLLDADGDCAKELAYNLAERGRSLAPPVPIAITCATRCYEAWFLASLSTIAGVSLKGTPGLPTDCQFDDSPEERLNPKKWITEQLPESLIYKETLHQAALTELIDLEEASVRSRSFRRLIHAVEQLLACIERGDVIVTP
ncbi:MAG: DUF4276 family protein [Candidatus Kapaibacterium sp.]